MDNRRKAAFIHFKKNASIVTDIDILHLFTRLGHSEIAPRHPGHGFISSNESANYILRKVIETPFHTNDIHD